MDIKSSKINLSEKMKQVLEGYLNERETEINYHYKNI